MIKDSTSRADVEGARRVGGFAGMQFGNTRIENSQAYGDVFAHFIRVGGFVGWQSVTSTIIDSTYLGENVEGDYYVGGFAEYQKR